MMKKHCIFPAIFVAALSLSACENARDTLGLTRDAPDEFKVVKRAPLSMPPGYNLMPPQPGAPRPQEQATSETARQAVFGDNAATQPQEVSDAENALLREAGADIAQPNIRQIVDTEVVERDDSQKPVAERLLGLGGGADNEGTVIDAKAEAERLRHNMEEGKPVTEGDTPSLDN